MGQWGVEAQTQNCWYELWLGSQWRRFMVSLMSDFITTTLDSPKRRQRGRNWRALEKCRSHTHLLVHDYFALMEGVFELTYCAISPVLQMRLSRTKEIGKSKS